MTQALLDTQVVIDEVAVAAYKIPTDQPEADGTYHWDHTTLVLVEVSAGGHTGIGYTYADTATAHLIHKPLSEVVEGRCALDIPSIWLALVRKIRNLGRPGIASMAISGLDNALWDLKARLLELPLCKLLGMAHPGVPIYGSGGFTSYSIEKLQKQLSGWVSDGIPRVKMKVGTHPEDDLHRVRAARDAIGPKVDLFVDANGAYSRKQALAFARLYAELGVVWFEEPVSSDDRAGLHLLRDQGPAGMDIAAGEYGYDMPYFEQMLEAHAVDVLQADATRCAGITGFLQAGGLCAAHCLALSAHCAPSLHVHAGCAVPHMLNLEYFHDHVRIEHMLFDGALSPKNGVLYPDLSRPGMGLDFKHADAERYLVWKS
jgi:L-alanine-DL-glutamate epimerase-like enolase superfamily enzyme